MLKNHKTAKQFNEEKWRRMRLIIEALREGKPLSFSEIMQLFSKPKLDQIVRRSIENYLAELVALQIVKYDADARLYSWVDIRKVFHSTLEIQLAREHSKSLLLSIPSRPRMFDIDPDYWLDYIIFNDKNKWARTEEKCLAQHFRSGYPDIFALMQKYRSQMDKIGSTGFVEQDLNLVETVRCEPTIEEKEPEKETDSHVILPKKTQELRQLLIGKIVDVIHDVAAGNLPLQGFCDYCPERRMILKDEKKV